MLSAVLRAVAQHRTAITLGLSALVVAGAGAWAQRSLDRRPLVVESTAPSPAISTIQVQVAGAVAKPGVYSLTAGDRVSEAVAAAGGPAPNADLESVSLAARVKDEMRVVVPTARATANPTKSGAVVPLVGPRSGLVDLNTATEAELELLPGIGPVTAGKIVDYRSRNGLYRDVDDLLAAKLISASTLERIRLLVVVR